jgi:hypothetical protein
MIGKGTKTESIAMEGLFFIIFGSQLTQSKGNKAYPKTSQQELLFRDTAIGLMIDGEDLNKADLGRILKGN